MTQEEFRSHGGLNHSDFLRDRSRKLRKNATYPERLLWSVLRNRRLHGLKFRRQVPVDKYIADFLCHEFMLIVELDGESHRNRGMADRHREGRLRQLGYNVLRIANDDVIQDLESVCQAILRVVEVARQAGQCG